MSDRPFRVFIGKHPCDDLPYIHETDPDPRAEAFTPFAGFDGEDYSGWYVPEVGDWVPVEPVGTLTVERKEYGPGFVGARVTKCEALFVDMDHELATILPPGEYLIVPVKQADDEWIHVDPGEVF